MPVLKKHNGKPVIGYKGSEMGHTDPKVANVMQWYYKQPDGTAGEPLSLEEENELLGNLNYQKATEIRKKSFGSLMTEKLVNGSGIGEAFTKTISDKTKAKVKGIKESFDMMNVAKKLTFGSKLAPALVGRIMGRSQEDIEHFAGKSEKKKSQSLGIGSKLLGMVGLGGDKSDSMQDVLGLIYRELQRAEEDKKLEKQQHENMLEGEEDEEETRNQELIEALTGKKHITGKKTKSERNQKEKPYRDEKGRFAKKPKTATQMAKDEANKTTPSAKKKGTSSILGNIFSSKGAAAAGIGAAVVGGVLLGSASDVIAKEEGVATKGYWDPPNQKNLVSIGYGHQIQASEYQQGFIQAGDEQIPIKGDKGIDTVMTKDQAKKLLAVDLPKYEKRAAAPLGDSWNKLNENQKTALISYAYNTGSTQSLVNAGLKGAIDSGDMKMAANIIREKGIKTAGGQYNKVLDQRRQREAALFESAVKVQDKPAAVPTQTTGDQIDSSSKENKDLKTPPKDAPAPVNVNTTNINSTNTSKQPEQTNTEDDRPAPLKKRRG